MKIGMVTHAGCVRVSKQSFALLSRGHEIHIIAGNLVPFGGNVMHSVSIYWDKRQLIRTVAASCADIFHVHNEPDWIVAATKEGAGDRPVIFDVHDLNSLRLNGEVTQEEQEAFEAADAFIHVSQPIGEYAETMHPRTKKPWIVLSCYVNEDFIVQKTNGADMRSIVYQGGIAPPSPDTDLTPKGQRLITYRNYLPMVQAFSQQGYEVHIFPARVMGNDNIYEDAGAVVYAPLFYPSLLKAMRVHGLGFVGSCVDTPLMQAAMPNKLFEYMSQGLCPVVMNAAEAARFVTEHQCGVVIDSFENLDEQLQDAERIHTMGRPIEVAFEYAMENKIHVVEDLYRRLI